MGEAVPNITYGLNELTPERWRRLWDAVAKIEGIGASQAVQPVRNRDRYGPYRRYRETRIFLAEITGATPFSSFPDTSEFVNRWRYSWVEVELCDDMTFGTVEDGASGDASVDDEFAINLVESGNDGTGVEAVGVNIDPGADYPPGFSLQPIGGSPVVWMRYTSEIPTGENADRTLRACFQLANDHDGTC